MTLTDKRHPVMRCVACHALYTNASLDGCPRCGADNRAWQAWVHAGRGEHLKRFFLGSRWGRLALASLLLPPVSWGALGVGLFSFETAALFVSLVLSLAGLFLLFAGRDALWIYELSRGLSPHFRAGLLHLGGAGFLIFAAVGGSLGLGWGVNLLRGEAPAFAGAGHWGATTLGVGLVFTGQALAAGLYAVYAYGRWLSRAFPRPVFLDEAHLLGLIDRATKPRIQVKTGGTYEAVTTQVVALSRTDQAGLNLLIRAEMGTNEVLEGRLLKAVQHWRAVSDKWGRVIQFEQEGPLEYVPDPSLGYARPDSQPGGEILDGEIILLT